ncbi:MAG: flagellar biosynthetic protein FliR [Hyphomicrobiaceae bacterium]
MTEELKLRVYVGIIVLARVSAFLSVAPILSALRIPPMVRAHVALVLSFALAAGIYPAVSDIVQTAAESNFTGIVAIEVMKGLFFGVIVRLIFAALAFAGDFISHAVGFTGMMVPNVIDGDTTGPLANLFMLSTAVLFFVHDLHLLLIERLIASYDTLPIGQSLDRLRAFDVLGATLSSIFFIALQISSPFVVYVMVCNILLGLANRLVPQVPIQLVSAPLTLVGGLFVAMFTLGLAAQVFLTSLATGLSELYGR